MASSSSSLSDPSVFSLRIVTFDYYMSPPVHDLDFSYSSFQGRDVEEVPVIRIFGSTPAGQKACLHVHQALPYLYIPCRDSALKSPEEGHKFIHILSNAIEKALKRKGSSATKRQHVHECRLVRAKKLYGYHASDDLFVKIYLYYPHEVACTATMLLEGAILNTSFQPYESHIPYLLHFLVDYNLYGMGHIHLSKFKFRSPIPDCCNAGVACFQKHGTKVHGNSEVWLSSTVPSELIWPDSAPGNGWQDKTKHLIRRQSTCSLEVDASVNDILNERHKMFTSLSQTRSDVKMVQSLVPIWEEEYERSGTPDMVQSPDARKPTSENVLSSFNHGLDYNRALCELCGEINGTFPFGVSRREGDGRLKNSIESFASTGKELAILEPSSSYNPSREPLKSLGEESKNVPLLCTFLLHDKKDTAFYKICQVDTLKSTSDKIISEVSRSTEHESIDTEALGLLSWLASSQAAEDVSTDDELVHEAILSPLLPTKSYKEALEMAHLDYENASQKECQDILDSLEGFHGYNGLKEQVSCSTDQDVAVSISSGNAIPQVDGSADDDDFNTLQKGSLSEANITGERDKYSAYQIEGCSNTRLESKHKRSRLLWGPLPFSFKKEEPENPERAVLSSPGDEKMKSDSESSSSAGHQGDRCDARLKAGNVKSGKLATLNSVRDLMRRKRQLRTEVSDAMMQNIEMMSLSPEELINRKYEIKGCNIVPQQSPNIESSGGDQGRIDRETITCMTTCRQDTPTENKSMQIDYRSPTNRNSLVSLFSDPVIQSNMLLEEATPQSHRFAMTDPTLPQVESIKFNESGRYRNIGTAPCNTISGGHEILMPGYCQDIMRTCSGKFSALSQKSLSLVAENPNVDEDLRFYKRENQSFDESLAENIDICARNLSAAHVEQILMHDARDCRSNQDKAQESSLQTHRNIFLPSDSPLHKNVQNKKDYVRGGCRHSSVNPDCENDTPEAVEMSFSTKPPSIHELGECPMDSPGTSTHAENREEINGDFPPFFSWNLEDWNTNKLLNAESLIFRQDSALGVPTHFQNDGSVLYLLTHATSPPNMESVHQWLLEVTQRNCWNASAGDVRQNFLEETGATRCLKLDISNQDDITDTEGRSHGSRANAMFNHQHEADLHTKNNPIKIGSQDLSQISGPGQEEKLGLTPLSQIGFRDTASLGAGQQLTLISIEVQAESRGDLLPDPKIDAINVISIAIQEDSSHIVEVNVLMRGASEEPCGRNVDGISNCKLIMFNDEKHLLDHFIKMISSLDPDVLMGWEIQGGSLGFLAERAAHLGISLLKKISRTPVFETKAGIRVDPESSKMQNDAMVADAVSEYSIIEDEWGRTHASGIHVTGRIVLNIWRLMRAELKLHMYSVEAVAEDTLRRKIPFISNRVLNDWYQSGPGRARYRCIQYVTERSKLNLEIMNHLDTVNRTSELARVFGIDFFSVLSRGSQFRVESMLLRLAHTQNYLAISPGTQQVASQPAMECLPLVMEPESGFYTDPVVVLDFQSLYPSMIIAYNLCYSTCLGTVVPSKTNILGVGPYLPDPRLLKDLREQLLLTPNGIMYVPPKVRRGVLPRLLEEILATRIMVKKAMKKLNPSQQVLQRVFNARQLALKLIANVTYGYTAAGFSGRMPCAELADSIVQCGRKTLETAISFVNQHDKWKARVVYGDTDSMFVLLKGRSRAEAFRIGNEIASAITAMNPTPVTLKMEKVYHPCFLLTKKRYVGYSYETPDQEKPTFDAKGIETVRRDTCPAVAKTLERSLRLIFEHQDISIVKTYLQRQWKRVLSGKVSLQDFVFSKEVRLGAYSTRASSLPPAAIVAIKAMQTDPRAEPRYGERIPYVVIHGEPGARLVDMVVNPHILLDANSPYRLNELYYINKQIIPALQRVFGLVRADLNQWFSELPRAVRPTLAKRHSIVSHSGSFHESDSSIRSETSRRVPSKRSRIDTYYISKHCTLCGRLAQASAYLCSRCSKKESLVVAAVVGKASRLEKEVQHLAAICSHCGGGGDWVVESGVKCTSLACSVFYERRKVQKEFQAISSFATEAGYYPMCMPELF